MYCTRHRTEATPAVLPQQHQNATNIFAGQRRRIAILLKTILNLSFRFPPNRPKHSLLCQIRIMLFTLILFQKQFLHRSVSDIWFCQSILLMNLRINSDFTLVPSQHLCSLFLLNYLIMETLKGTSTVLEEKNEKNCHCKINERIT